MNEDGAPNERDARTELLAAWEDRRSHASNYTFHRQCLAATQARQAALTSSGPRTDKGYDDWPWHQQHWNATLYCKLDAEHIDHDWVALQGSDDHLGALPMGEELHLGLSTLQDVAEAEGNYHTGDQEALKLALAQTLLRVGPLATADRVFHEVNHPGYVDPVDDGIASLYSQRREAAISLISLVQEWEPEQSADPPRPRRRCLFGRGAEATIVVADHQPPSDPKQDELMRRGESARATLYEVDSRMPRESQVAGNPVAWGVSLGASAYMLKLAVIPQTTRQLFTRPARVTGSHFGRGTDGFWRWTARYSAWYAASSYLRPQAGQSRPAATNDGEEHHSEEDGEDQHSEDDGEEEHSQGGGQSERSEDDGEEESSEEGGEEEGEEAHSEAESDAL